MLSNRARDARCALVRLLIFSRTWQVANVSIHGDPQLMVLPLLSIKGAHRPGDIETVLINDSVIISLGIKVLSRLSKASTATTTKSSRRLLGRIGDETLEVPKSTANGNAIYVAS